MLTTARLTAAFASVLLGLCTLHGATAAQLNDATASGTTGLNAASIKPYPSALTATYTVGGASELIVANNVPLTTLGGGSAAMLTPPVPTTTTGIQLQTDGAGCNFANNAAVSTSCARGTLQVSFSRPVTNPVLHFIGLGSVRSVTGDTTTITAGRAVHTIASSVPAGATMTLLGGAVNLQSLGGTTLDLVNANYNGTNCTTITAPATQLAGCGSVRINGTYTSITFNVSLAGTRNVFNATIGNEVGADGYMLTATVDEDFGDAPASYDASAAASHIVGGPRLGATVDADNTGLFNTTPAVTPSPNAVAAGADANGAAGDGADEDALATPLPTLHTGLIGQIYALAPSVSNVTAAAAVCGWIDFNRNGVFETAERTCTSIAAGATSAPLAWTVPVATTAGRTYVRVRASYDTNGVQSPTGRIDSGEVEDYMTEIKPAVRVIKSLAPASDGGRFDLGIGGTLFAAGAGNGGTTDFRTLYHTSAAGAPDLIVAQNIATTPITTSVAEAPTPATTGLYASTYLCANGAGVTVATGTGTSVNITLPVSVTGAAANGRSQAVTCTFTNSAASVSVSKTTPVTSISAPGNIPYTIVVANTGAAPLTGVNPIDVLPHGGAGVLTLVSGDVNTNGVLDAGEAWMFSSSYTATQADVDAGANLVNTVSVTTTQTPTPVSASATTTVVRAPAMTVVKSTPTTSINAPGTIAYTIAVHNTGNVTLTGLTPVDTLPHGTNGTVTFVSGDANGNGALDVGETWTYSANYAATQADIDAGTNLVNTVSVTSAQTSTPVTGSATTTITRAPAMTVVKSTPTTSISAPGAIAYTITVRNTGNVTLTGVTPVDTLPGGANGPVTLISGDVNANGKLDVGETWVFSASYTATQADIDAGTNLVNNVSVTSAQTPTPVTGSATTTITRAPAMTVVKTTPTTSISAPGPIAYTIVVHNTGNIALTGVTPVDTLPGGANGPVTLISGDVNANGKLDVGETWTYSASYTATQADIDAGTNLVNNVSVTSAQTPAPVTGSATTTITRAPAMTVVKTTPTTSISAPGPIAYTIVVHNTGNIALTGVTPVDTLPGGANGALTLVSGDVNANGKLDVGETWTYSASYTATQADIDAGTNLVNTVSVTTTQITTPVTSSATTTITRAPAMTVVKTTPTTSISAPGPIPYTIAIHNTGNVTLTGVVPVDTLPNGTNGTVALVSGDTDGDNRLDLGETWIYSASYTATQADIDAGADLVNRVSVTTTQIATPVTSSATTTITRANVAVAKTGPATIAAGATITYTVVASNAGPGAADGAAFSDPIPAGLTGVTATCATSAGAAACGPVAVAGGSVTSTITSLPSGGSVTFSISGTAPANAGTLSNTASIAPPASAADPDASDNTSTAVTTVTPVANVSIVKNGPATATSGGAITYTLLIGNAGPSAADGAHYTDALPAGIGAVTATCGSATGGAACAAPSVAGGIVSGTVPILPANGSVTITIAGTAPFGAQNLVNTATVAPPAGTADPVPGNDSSTVDTAVGAAADIATTKTVDDAAPVVGDTVTFTISATNIGPDDATGVALTDNLPFGLVFVSATPSQGTFVAATGLWTVGDLADGASATLTLVATVGEPGGLVNTVAVSASDQPDPDASNNTAAAALNAGASADIGLAKTVDDASPNVGTDVTYTITATNNGPSDATGIEVTDSLPAGTTLVSAAPAQGTYDGGSGVWSVGALADGASATLTIVASVDQPGSIMNTATITHEEAFDANPANNTAGVAINGQSADIGLTKTVDDTAPDVGDTVSFTITAHNSGPSDATGVVVADALPAGLAFVSATPTQGMFDDATGQWTIGTLTAAGPTSTATLTLVATVTEAGALTNTATVTAADQPDPNLANNTASASANGSPLADLAVTKSGPATVTPGDDAVYTITLTNAGPSAAANVVVSDPTPAGLDFVSNAGGCTSAYPCSIALLASGASVTITSTYAVPFDYRGANPIRNTASATSDTPDPTTTNNQASAQTGVGAGNADVSIDKQGPASVAAGGAITYTLRIANDGPSPANGARYDDAVPAAITGVTASCAGELGGAACVTQPDVIGHSVSGTVGTLPSGGSVIVTIAGIAPAGPATVQNTATADVPAGVVDPDAGNNRSTVSTSVSAAAADVGVLKQGPAQLVPGTDASFTLTVTNAGPDTARAVQLDDAAPPGLGFVSASAPCASGFPCALGDLPSGASATVTAIFAVAPGAAGAITNTATVSSSTADPNAANDRSTVTVPVTMVAPQADLAIAKSGPSSVAAGGALAYAIVVSNGGPDAADGASFADPLPAGVTATGATCGSATGGAVCGAVAVAGGDVTSTITALPSGGSVTFSIAATAPANATTLTNTATIAPPAGGIDPNPANDSSSAATEVVAAAAVADLVASKTGPTSANPGDAVVYTIRVVNNGPAAVPDATLADPTPAGLSFVSTTAPCTNGFPCALGALANGASVTVQASYRVEAGYAGTLANVATVSSPTVADPTPNNNASSAATAVGGGSGSAVVPVPVDARWTLALLTLLLMIGGVAGARVHARTRAGTANTGD